jgi:putative aldouronate transport system substrate-binding protein
MKKLAYSTLAVTLLAVTVLAGCASKEENQAGSSPVETKKKDITATIYDRGNVPAAEGSIENNRWTKWLNEQGPANVKFVAIPRSEAKAKLNVLFASGSAPDLIFEYSPAIMDTMYLQKQLLPLDDLIEKHSTVYKNLIKEYPALKKAGTKPDGKVYAAGRLAEVTPIHGLLIRNDWLKKLNLAVPKTVDELLVVAQAFKDKDPDGNGKNDTYGISMSQKSDDVIKSFFNAYGPFPNLPLVVKDGKVVIAWENQKMAVDYQKKIFEMGLVDKDFLNDKNGAKAKQDFLTSKLGIYPLQVGDYYGFAMGDLTTLKKNDPNAEIIPMAYPESPAGSYNPAFTNPVQVTAYVNVAAKSPEAVMQYIDFASKPETTRQLNVGFENVHHKIGKSGCPEITDADKFKTEVGYTGDMTMLQSKVLDTKCGSTDKQFNVEIPIQKEGLELSRKAKSVYLDVNKPYPGITHPEHMPTLPQDLALTVSSMTTAITDMWIKAILSGASYSTDQAMKDSIAAWEKADGKKVEEFYVNWYKDKNKAFLAQDIYDILRKQK